MRRSAQALMDRLNDRVDEGRGDWGVRLEVSLEGAWSAEVRVTEHPNVKGAPDRSVVFHQAGGGDPEDVLVPALRAAMVEVLTWDPARPRPATWDDEPPTA